MNNTRTECFCFWYLNFVSHQIDRSIDHSHSFKHYCLSIYWQSAAVWSWKYLRGFFLGVDDSPVAARATAAMKMQKKKRMCLDLPARLVQTSTVKARKGSRLLKSVCACVRVHACVCVQYTGSKNWTAFTTLQIHCVTYKWHWITFSISSPSLWRANSFN